MKGQHEKNSRDYHVVSLHVMFPRFPSRFLLFSMMFPHVSNSVFAVSSSISLLFRMFHFSVSSVSYFRFYDQILAPKNSQFWRVIPMTWCCVFDAVLPLIKKIGEQKCPYFDLWWRVSVPFIDVCISVALFHNIILFLVEIKKCCLWNTLDVFGKYLFLFYILKQQNVFLRSMFLIILFTLLQVTKVRNSHRWGSVKKVL